MKTQKSEVIAAIDVGSNSIRMKIAEIRENGKVVNLEDLRKTTNLGRDVFSEGFVRAETIQKTCDVLNDYSKTMKAYKIKHYRAVATSAVREAKNSDYMLDQIKVKTGMEIEVINNAQERYITYKSLKDKLADFQTLKKEGALIVDIGSGGVEITVYQGGSLLFTENIKVGSLRLREILYDLERKTLNFPEIMESFVESKIYLLRPVLKALKLKHFIGLGGETKVITILCNNKMEEQVRIKKGDLSKLLGNLKNMTTQNIVHKYGISTERAEILLPSVIIFEKFIQMVDTDQMIAPLVSLRDGLVADIADDKLKLRRKMEFQEDIVASVKHLGRRYSCDEAHASQVEKLALSIFDQMEKLHGMGEKERFYLQLASLLHDVGKYISLDQHTLSSCNIILSSDILGLSHEDVSIIANVTRYHSDENPGIEDENYRLLNPADRIRVSKLSAILKLADSLDISHKQGIRGVDIAIDENLLVRLDADNDITLEQWTFENKTDFFHQVFGVKAIIKRKGR